MKVELFIPCFIDQFYPDTAFNTVKILEKLGCNVIYNIKQTCCGQPAYNAGFWNEAKEVAQKFLNEHTSNNYIVSPAGSCVGMIKKGYSDLFLNGSSHNSCRQVQQNIHELSEFIVNILKIDQVPGARLEGKAVYHDSCNALRECKIKAEPRLLLSNVEGLELIEFPAHSKEVCCGFGGTFAVKFEGISTAMAEQKVNAALEVGAEYIISTDSSCLMHLHAYISKNNIPLKTMSIADILASGL